MPRSIARSTALTFVAAALLLACKTEGPTATGINELPQNLGTEIATSIGANVLAELAWSANGSEIYFQTDESQGQLAAASLNGATRILAGPRDGYYDVVTSSDAAAVYFAADRLSGVRSVYRLALADGSLETLTTHGSGTVAAAPADGRLAQPSPDGTRVAFAALPDSVFVQEAATGTRTFVGTGCERIVDWSPDQTTLLCQTGRAGTGVYRTLDIATGLSAVTSIVPLNQGAMQLIDWQGTGVWASYINFAGIYAWNPQAQAGVPLLALSGVPGTAIDPRNADWTRDGSKIAYWVHQCLVRRGLGTCEKGQSLLYVSDLVANRTGMIAVAKGTQGGQYLALSPDGSRVAFLFNGRIYWQSTTLP
jgi:Tol biopolymer transport system component